MPTKSDLRLVMFLIVITTALTIVVRAQTKQAPSVPPESSRWNLEGQAKVTEYQNRKSLFLDGGAATLNDLQIRDAVIDLYVATASTRGFFGIQFRLTDDGANGE